MDSIFDTQGYNPKKEPNKKCALIFFALLCGNLLENC